MKVGDLVRHLNFRKVGLVIDVYQLAHNDYVVVRFMDGRTPACNVANLEVINGSETNK